jgi:hypothetical protein
VSVDVDLTDQDLPAEPSWRAPVKGVLLLSGAGIALGAAMGIAWEKIVPELTFTAVKGGGIIPTGSTNDDWFSADGWFAVLGAIVGVLLFALAWWRVRRHPLAAVFGVLIGGLLAALVAWWLGGILGPPGPRPLKDYSPGAEVVAQLGLRATGVLLIPAIVGVLLVVLLATFTTPKDMVDIDDDASDPLFAAGVVADSHDPDVRPGDGVPGEATPGDATPGDPTPQ